MEELKMESIKNKNGTQKPNNTNINDQKKEITNQNLEHNKKDITKIEDMNNKDLSKNELLLDPEKELEKIKLSHIKKYSLCELIIKSIMFSSHNIRLHIFNIIKKFINQYINLKIPLVYGKLLNSIIKQKNYELLCSEFKKHSLFLFFRLILNEVFELFSLLFVTSSGESHKKKVLENILQKDIDFFDLYKTNEVFDGINRNQNMLNSNFLFTTIDVLMDVYNFFYLLFFLNYSSLSLMLLFFFVQFCKFGSELLLLTYTDFRNKPKRKGLKQKYNDTLFEFINNMKLTKSMCVEDMEMEKLFIIKGQTDTLFCSTDAIVNPILEFFHKMLDTSIIFLAGKYITFGQMDYSDLTIFQNYSNQLIKSFQKIKKGYKQYIDMYDGWKKFFEIYDFEPTVISLKNYIPEKEEDFKYEFEFKNVCFSYPLRPNALVYNNLSLKIEHEKVTAFVGYSGGGKSTIVNLILRLYDPLSGDIFLNDTNLKDFNIKWYRQKIGYVSQEPMLVSGSIEDNIKFGIKTFDQKQFEEVCSMTNLDFVNDKTAFPHGFKTLVGERGNKLSGGQKQRIAIARALMRDIKILILDEATSALDSKNEKELQDSIEKIIKIKKITTIIIAHRLSTVKNADVIMFIDKGRIVEKGTHEELLEKNGEYKKLIQNQLIKTNPDK